MHMDQYIGRLLDNRYEILDVLGTGGMAVVYKARCHRLNRLVAIKILKDEFSRDEEFRRRFNAEGEAVAMLSHPNIVQVYDVSSTNAANFIVMELIDGISLKQYMEKKGVLNWKETLHFAMQIAKGLEHAHSRGIVHRDIKPHNVMVLKNGSVKVMDFGIARVMSKTNTLTKEALGSVHYISPEQAKGGWVDNRSDLYSLGVVMYEMMTGRPPYDGESPVAVAIQHINGGARMPSTLNPNIPGGMEQIIMKGMALDTKNRYSSAGEMLKDMEEFRKNPMILFPYGGVKTAGNATGTAAAAGAAGRTTAERVAGRRAEGSSGQSGPSRTAGAATAAAVRQRRNNPTGQSGAVSRNTGNVPGKNRRDIQKAEEKSRATTIAIVTCSAVAAVAILIFLIALMSGGLFRRDMVEVPNLLGQTYYSGMTIDNLIIKAEHTYNADYPKGTIFDQNPPSGSQVVKGAVIKVTVSMGEEPPIVPMPNLIGQTKDDAMIWLRGEKMNPLVHEEFHDEVEEGRVIRTDPAEGTELKAGQTVHVYISKGPVIQKAKMPLVEDLKLERARKVLEDAGFKNVKTEYVESDKDMDVVLEQSVAYNTEIDVTTEIILTVSQGQKATMPNVVGLKLNVAKEKLDDAGFKNVKTKYVESDKPVDEVIKQSVTSKTEIDVTTEIVLTISQGPKENTEETTTPEEPEQPQEITKTVSIPLPKRDGAYVLSIYYNGSEVQEASQILPGTTTFSIRLTGTGKQTYELYIDGEFYRNYEVEFK